MDKSNVTGDVFDLYAALTGKAGNGADVWFYETGDGGLDVYDTKECLAALAKASAQSNEAMICLVSSQTEEIVRLHRHISFLYRALIVLFLAFALLAGLVLLIAKM